MSSNLYSVNGRAPIERTLLGMRSGPLLLLVTVTAPLTLASQLLLHPRNPHCRLGVAPATPTVLRLRGGMLIATPELATAATGATQQAVIAVVRSFNSEGVAVRPSAFLALTSHLHRVSLTPALCCSAVLHSTAHARGASCRRGHQGVPRGDPDTAPPSLTPTPRPATNPSPIPLSPSELKAPTPPDPDTPPSARPNDT